MSQDQCRRRTPTRSGLRRATRVPRSASPWGQPSPRTPPTSPRSADRSWSGAGRAKHPRRDSRTLRTQLFRCRSRPRPEARFLGHASSAPGLGLQVAAPSRAFSVVDQRCSRGGRMSAWMGTSSLVQVSNHRGAAAPRVRGGLSWVAGSRSQPRHRPGRGSPGRGRVGRRRIGCR
jgi:hypothetical protein